MQNSYNFLLGIALIIFITVGDKSDNKRFIDLTNNSEVTEEDYNKAGKVGGKNLYKVEKASFDYDAAISPTGLVVGVGLIIIGIINRKKK